MTRAATQEEPWDRERDYRKHDDAPPFDPGAKLVGDASVAAGAADAELKNARALGMGWFDAYASSYRVLDEVLEISRKPMPATVLTKFRPHPKD